MKLSHLITTGLLATPSSAKMVGRSAATAPAAGAKMEKMMALKEQQWAQAAEKGLFANHAKQTETVKCEDGYAGEYQCGNVDMHAFLSHAAMGAVNAFGNDVWGWTHKASGREFGLVGQRDGTAFVEIDTVTGALEYVGRLDTQTTAASWRDIKVIGDYAYIGSEAPDHGLQIFDLNKLVEDRPVRGQGRGRRDKFTPKNYSTETDITHFGGFGSSHNIVAQAENKMIYAVGGRSGANSRNTTCAGGMFMVDVSDPLNPFSPGCAFQDGYVHDAQCVIYTGPTEEYTGHEICFNFNEDTLTIMDLTDKTNPVIISKTPYDGNEYTHQGWLTDETMKFLLLDDEQDELNQAGPPRENNHTTTYIFDVSDLHTPINTGYYQSPAKSIDHNQYVADGLSYQANYGSGLRIIDVSGLHEDPTGGNIEQTGFFDCYPEDDDVNGVVEFLGTWSVYPYFESGFILLNSIERGIYSLKYTGRGKAF